MTSLNAALNFNFASAEAARIVYAERGADDTIAAQLKQAAANAPFEVGTTITARYQYKVTEDGSLVPLRTQVTTDRPEEEVRSQNRRSRQSQREDERRPTLNDLAKPKAELSPADELALFADASTPASAATATLNASQAEVSEVAAVTSPVGIEVLDENGESVQAELVTPKADTAKAGNYSPLRGFALAAQYAVAGLYARNSEIAYNVTPLARFAA